MASSRHSAAKVREWKSRGATALGIHALKKRTLTALGATLAAIVMVIMYATVTSPRRNLDRFLKQVATVEVGKTRFSDLRGQAERAHISNVRVKCDQQVCFIAWRGENTILQKLRLAPLTYVQASVGFKDGVADEIYIIMEMPTGPSTPSKIAVVRQSVRSPSACRAPHYEVVGPSLWAISVGMHSMCVHRRPKTCSRHQCVVFDTNRRMQD